MNTPQALVLIVEGVEELEAVAPIDCLRRAGVEVRVASASPARKVTGRNGIVLEADCALEDCLEAAHDLVVVPGGPGHKTLAEDPRVLDLLRRHAGQSGRIGSICAGPVVLDRAGLLQGRTFTSFPGTAQQLPERDPSRKVIREGNLVTAQGAGCAVEFALELVDLLCGPEKRKEIAGAICH